MNIRKYLEDLEKLVNIESGSCDVEGCRTIVKYFNDEYRKLGFETVIYGKENENPYLEGHYKGRDVKDETIDIMFMGHLDTVFERGTVAERPFTKDENRCYGPGVADMKDGALLALELARSIVHKKLNINLCVAFNSDEEIGSPASENWIKELGAKSKYAFNFEPGRVNGAFVKERKGVYDYYVDFRGVASHAGVAPEKGASAVLEMGRWITELTTLAKPELGTTLNPGIVKGGSASNVIAAEASMVIDLRYKTEEERIRVEDAFTKMKETPQVKGVITKWHRGDGFPPMCQGPHSETLINLMERIALENKLTKPDFVSTGGGSDANNLGGLGVTAMDGCGPVGDDYHSDAEYMDISSVEERYILILNTIKALENDLQ